MHAYIYIHMLFMSDLFGCSCIYLNLCVLEWIQVKLSLIFTPIHLNTRGLGYRYEYIQTSCCIWIMSTVHPFCRFLKREELGYHRRITCEGKMSTGKTSWPEVLGWPATQAVTQINSDRPDVAIEVIPVRTTVAPGYNAKRVRVFFDATNSLGPVVVIPVVG